MPSPNGVSVAAYPAVPLTGNFTWTDDFDQPKLSPLWIMLRAPKETWWQLGDGKLSLTPRTEHLSGKGNPSFYGRRLQHSKFEAATQLQIPATPGTSAGLAVVQNETHHYYFAVRRTADGLSAFVEKWNGPMPETLITRLLPADTRSIELRLTGDEKFLYFAYALQPGEWNAFLLPQADSYPISVQAAGGGLHFTGAIVGLHTRIE